MIVAALLASTGCSSSTKAPQAKSNADQRLIDPIDNPLGSTASVMVQSAVLPLGAVPYDNLALPIVSPDGRYVATQTGVPPTWSAVLAEPGAEVPGATQIEIYELDRREGVANKDRRPPTLVTTMSQPALLGRSCDASGFLVEVPREDGSRWIGTTSWKTGEILWLITDEQVNAFASLGPGGRLAWSRRAPDAEKFDLVVRHAATEWSISAGKETWLLPTWTQSGRLFSLALEGGNLEARYAIASDAQAFHQSQQRFRIAADASVHTAYQCLSGQGQLTTESRSPSDAFLFFHPAMQRMALWRPLAPSGQRALHLNAGSIAALIDNPNSVLVATGTELMRQSLVQPQQRVHLAIGTQVPRATPSSGWPYLLLKPGEGQIDLTAMRLLPLEQALTAQRAAVKPAPSRQ
jgi:hypothetical protein